MNLSPVMETVLSRRTLPTDVAELSLVLPGWQMRELADAAADRGVTVGQLLRGCIQQLLQRIPKIAEN